MGEHLLTFFQKWPLISGLKSGPSKDGLADKDDGLEADGEDGRVLGEDDGAINHAVVQVNGLLEVIGDFFCVGTLVAMLYVLFRPPGVG